MARYLHSAFASRNARVQFVFALDVNSLKLRCTESNGKQRLPSAVLRHFRNDKKAGKKGGQTGEHVEQVEDETIVCEQARRQRFRLASLQSEIFAVLQWGESLRLYRPANYSCTRAPQDRSLRSRALIVWCVTYQSEYMYTLAVP